MKKSGSVTVFNNNLTSSNTITVIFEDDSTTVEKVIDKAGEVLYEAEGGGE